jgi:hypothetical protein
MRTGRHYKIDKRLFPPLSTVNHIKGVGICIKRRGINFISDHLTNHRPILTIRAVNQGSRYYTVCVYSYACCMPEEIMNRVLRKSGCFIEVCLLVPLVLILKKDFRYFVIYSTLWQLCGPRSTVHSTQRRFLFIIFLK